MEKNTHTRGLLYLEYNKGIVLSLLWMLPLSQLPTHLQPLRVCAGVQGGRHGCHHKNKGA